MAHPLEPPLATLERHVRKLRATRDLCAVLGVSTLPMLVVLTAGEGPRVALLLYALAAGSTMVSVPALWLMHRSAVRDLESCRRRSSLGQAT